MRALSTRFADYLLECDCSAGRGVFFVGVVAFEYLTGVIVMQGGGGGAGYVEEQIYSDGKVGGVDESGFVLFDQGADVIDFFVPAGGADDHILAGSDAGFDVGEDAVRGAEIDYGVDVVEIFWSEGGAGRVFLGACDLHVMFAGGGDFRY